jgi:RimJ/RimL family protein N-acetyltransferase
MMIRLEKFGRADYDRFISWIDSEEMMVQFSGSVFHYPVTHDQLDRYVDDENALIYKVVDEATNEVVGHAEIGKIDRKNMNARVSRILIGDPSKRNRGYGKAIIQKLIDIGFNELGLHRLELGVYDFNKGAIRCYEECGFKIEGLLKENKRFGDTFWSTYNMSIINSNVSSM